MRKPVPGLGKPGGESCRQEPWARPQRRIQREAAPPLPEARSQTRRWRGTASTEGAVHGPPGLQGHHSSSPAQGGRRRAPGYRLSRQQISPGWPSQCQPAQAQVLHHHQAARRRRRPRADAGARGGSARQCARSRPQPQGLTPRASPPEKGWWWGPGGASGQAPCSPWLPHRVSGLQTSWCGLPRCSPLRPSGAATCQPAESRERPCGEATGTFRLPASG